MKTLAVAILLLGAVTAIGGQITADFEPPDNDLTNLFTVLSGSCSQVSDGGFPGGRIAIQGNPDLLLKQSLTGTTVDVSIDFEILPDIRYGGGATFCAISLSPSADAQTNAIQADVFRATSPGDSLFVPRVRLFTLGATNSVSSPTSTAQWNRLRLICEFLPGRIRAMSSLSAMGNGGVLVETARETLDVPIVNPWDIIYVKLGAHHSKSLDNFRCVTQAEPHRVRLLPERIQLFRDGKPYHGIQISWQSTSNKIHRVQFHDGDGKWQTLLSTTNRFPTVKFIDPAHHPVRFYRVVEDQI